MENNIEMKLYQAKWFDQFIKISVKNYEIRNNCEEYLRQPEYAYLRYMFNLRDIVFEILKDNDELLV
jgi:hypothetical protein